MADFINLDAAYDSDTLTDWYISSVGSEPPVWTDEHIEELLNDFYVIPKDTPAADVAPVKHGHWKRELMSPKIGLYGYICLNCNKLIYVGIGRYMTYCGNCGAKMDGGD